MHKTYPLKIIGLGCPAPESPLPPSHAKLLAELLTGTEVICGGKAQLRLLGLDAADSVQTAQTAPSARQPQPPLTLIIDARIDALAEKLRQLHAAGKKISILASGDPLLFGIGATLTRYFKPAELRFYPAVSSMQEACARLALPWHELQTVSLHGRDWRAFTAAILDGKPLCVLLDQKNSPGKIARWLLERGVEHYRLHYFANLQSRTATGPEQETYLSLELRQAAQELMKPRTETGLVILLPADGAGPGRPFLGMPDESFAHSAGLITKQPVRAAVLAALRLKPEHVLLELGAGCGSVGLEASALLRAGQVYCVERKPERVSQILANRAKFGAVNIEVLQAEALDCLGDLSGKTLGSQKSATEAAVESSPLPAPDRIFIGGGLAEGQASDNALLTAAWNRLKPGGRLALSCILLSSLESSLNFFATLKIVPEVISIQAGIGAPLAGSIQLKALNQVFILAARKEARQPDALDNQN